MSAPMTAEELEHIDGAAQTLQWASDAHAGAMMLDLVAEVRRLREVEALCQAATRCEFRGRDKS